MSALPAAAQSQSQAAAVGSAITSMSRRVSLLEQVMAHNRAQKCGIVLRDAVAGQQQMQQAVGQRAGEPLEEPVNRLSNISLPDPDRIFRAAPRSGQAPASRPEDQPRSSTLPARFTPPAGTPHYDMPAAPKSGESLPIN